MLDTNVANLGQYIQTKYGVSVFAKGNVVLVIWRDPVTMQNWTWFRSQLAKACQTNESVVCGSIIYPSSDPPDLRIRLRIQQDFRKFDDRLHKFIMTPLGNGVLTYIAKTMLRALLVITRQPEKQEYCDDIDQCIRAVQRHGSYATPMESELHKAVEIMQHTLGLA